MKKKILALTVMSILVIACLVGIAKATKAPLVYEYSALTLGNKRCPRFSPNGKWIAYHSNEKMAWGEIIIQKVDDNTTLTVFDADNHPAPNDSVPLVGVPVWTPDGKSIYFWYGYQEKGVWYEYIYAVDVKIRGSNVDVIGEPYEILYGGTSVEASYPVENFDISPNGKFLVFWRIETGKADLYLVPRRLDGTFNIDDRIQLTETSDTSEYEPRFSPDGKEIVFFCGEGDAHSGYWVEVISIDSLGSPVEESRRWVKQDARWPFWSPDGKHLGITKYHSSGYDIEVIDSDTGELLWEVTNSATGNPSDRTTTADWSPTDWNSIVFRVAGVGISYADAQHPEEE